MKRIIGILLAMALLLAPGAAHAEYDFASVPTPRMILVDGDDPSTVFYEREADTVTYPASTTKIMTCILALELGNREDIVTVGDEISIFSKYSSLMGLTVGEQVRFEDLLYGMMLPSGNDAATTLAVHLAGSVEAFAGLMNQKAAALGMTNTHFTNSCGIQDVEHVTTARDLAKLTAYALANEDFVKIVGTDTYITAAGTNLHPMPYVLNNTNKLIKTRDTDTEACLYEYAIGVKTGETPAAGKCLVAAAEKDGARAILVLLGDANEAQYSRFRKAAEMFEYAFDTQYRTVQASSLGLETAFTASVANASTQDLPNGTMTLHADLTGQSVRLLTAKADAFIADAANITASVRWVDGLSAPISAGAYMGTVDYSYQGKTLFTATLLANGEVRPQAAALVSLPGETSGTASPDSASPTGTPGAPAGRGETEEVILIALLILILLLVVLLTVFILRRRREEKRRRARRQARAARKQY